MNFDLLSSEVVTINRRFANLCIRMCAIDELEACTFLNLEASFFRAIVDLSDDQLDFVTSGKISLLKPAITSRQLVIASQMKTQSDVQDYLWGLAK